MLRATCTFVVKIYTLDISDLTAVGDLLIVCRQLWGCQIYTFTITTIDVLLLGYKIDRLLIIDI